MPGQVKKHRKSSGSTKDSTKKVTEGKKNAEESIVPEIPEDDVEESEDEDDGVTEEGMAKLMKALGDDGLDEIGQMQLEVLEGDEDSEDGEDSDEDVVAEGGEEVDEDEDGESVEEDGSGDEDEDEDEDGSADEDGDEDEDETAEEISNAKRKITMEVDEDDNEDVVALDDVESIDEDVVPRQKIVKNDTQALSRILDTIKLDPSLSWTETLSITYPETIDVDVSDDLNRELAFYKQALHGAKEARKLAEKLKFPFTRPSDYFAEMVKSDAHMERIRQKLLDENASIKKSELKRKEREGKKFGKQVQIEKQKERERSKKDMEERLKGLKRKRKDMLDPQTNGDDFDVAVEEAVADRPSKRSKDADGRSKMSRKGRDAKFGFGGKDRRAKQNTRESTEKFDYGKKNSKKPGGKGVKPNRPGKSRRMSAHRR